MVIIAQKWGDVKEILAIPPPRLRPAGCIRCGGAARAAHSRPYEPAPGSLVGAGCMPARARVPIPVMLRWFSRRGRCPHRPTRAMCKAVGAGAYCSPKPRSRTRNARPSGCGVYIRRGDTARARYRIAVCNAPGWLTGRRRRWFRRSRWTGRCSGRGS